MKTAIVFTSKYGTTQGCARKLSKLFGGSCVLIDLKDNKVPDISAYGRVIIGSPVYVGRISKEAADFCQAYQEALKDKVVGFFVCGIQKVKAQDTNALIPKSVSAIVRAQANLGGRIDFDKLSLPDKLVVSMLSKVDKSLAPMVKGSVLSTLSEEAMAEFAKSLS